MKGVQILMMNQGAAERAVNGYLYNWYAAGSTDYYYCAYDNDENNV